MSQLIDLFLHLDKHLQQVLVTYGAWTYLLLFLIIFLETGLVVTPILPGDSLLFAAGAFAATGSLNLFFLLVLLSLAAIAGDTMNYMIGRYVGPQVFTKKNSRFLKPEYIDKTQSFYDKYGSKTIVIARFVPIVRTFAPFVAGIGKMKYAVFISYNVIGGLAWIGICVLAGYLFGTIPIVKNNFTLVVLGIIALSILPAVIEVLKHRRDAVSKVSEPVAERTHSEQM